MKGDRMDTMKYVPALLAVLAVAPVIALAAWTPGDRIVPICSLECGCGFKEFSILIQNLVDLMVYLGVFIMVLVISYGGWLMMTSATNPGNRERAKKMIWQSVIGFVVLLAAFLIVHTFFSALTPIPWNTILNTDVNTVCPTAAPPVTLGSQGTVSVTSPGSQGENDPITAFRCTNPDSCSVSTATNARLAEMKRRLEELGVDPTQFVITETGVNTTVQHASASNNLDMSCRPTPPCNPDQVKAAIVTWQSPSGEGKVIYETNSQSDYQRMLDAGVPTANLLGPSWFTGTFVGGVCMVNGQPSPGRCITAPHMSLKP
jgi:hypothetical protein